VTINDFPEDSTYQNLGANWRCYSTPNYKLEPPLSNMFDLFISLFQAFYQPHSTSERTENRSVFGAIMTRLT